MAKKNGMKLVQSTGTKVINEHFEALYVQLTPDEIMARAKSLARIDKDESQAEHEFSLAKEIHKNAVAKIVAQRAYLLRAIDEEREQRPVKVQAVAHYATATMILTRLDTNQIVHQRALEAEEMQFKLDLGKEDDDTGEAAAP